MTVFLGRTFASQDATFSGDIHPVALLRSSFQIFSRTEESAQPSRSLDYAMVCEGAVQGVVSGFGVRTITYGKHEVSVANLISPPLFAAWASDLIPCMQIMRSIIINEGNIRHMRLVKVLSRR